MAPKWDDEDEESTPPSSPPPAARRGKFDDEEDEEEVIDDWEEADDSDAEREKAKKAAEAKAKAEALAKANHKTKAQRIEEHRQANLRRRQAEDGDEDEDSEDEAEKRARLRKSQKEADLAHAEDLFGASGGPKARSGKPVTVANPNDPANAIDLGSLKIFDPQTKDQFTKLRETLVPLVTANAKKAQYALFLQEFAKQIAKDLPSNEIKKIASGLTTLSNEKLKEEKAAEKGGKKSKAAKTKATLNANRDASHRADTTSYDDGLDDDDFM